MKKSTLLATIILFSLLQRSHAANLNGMPWQGDYEYAITAEELGNETNPINIDLEYLEKMMEESETQRRQAAKLLRDRGADIPEFEDALFKVIDLPRIEAIENNDRKTLEHIAKLEKAFIEIRLQNNNQDLS